MRGNRRSMGGEGMGLAPMIGIAVAVLLVAGAIGFTIYGGSVQPTTRHYEQVVPDDRLPH
jgi:hypothetical protein